MSAAAASGHVPNWQLPTPFVALTPPAPHHKHIAAGSCNSTATIAAIAQLRADIIARTSQTTPIEIYCVDAPATGRRLLATSTLYGSVCPNDPNFLLPQSATQDATKPKLVGQCSLSYAVSDQPYDWGCLSSGHAFQTTCAAVPIAEAPPSPACVQPSPPPSPPPPPPSPPA